MPFFRDQQPSPGLSYPIAPDLLEITPNQVKHFTASQRVFRVLSDVLSDLKIHTGDIVSMSTLAPLMRPPPYAVVAVHLAWTGVLLLRQYVPPRLLITNSGRLTLPYLQLRKGIQIIASLEPNR